MNINETCGHFAGLAKQKARAAAGAPGAFFISSMLGGAYIGIALILAYTCAAGLDPGVRPLVTGGVFGVGLILVVLAGAELFTGHVMYESFGLSLRTIGLGDVIRMFVLVWLGNLVGAALLSFLFVKGGGSLLTTGTYLHDVIVHKETSPFIPLLSRAILCNWLVCLAVWLAARMKSETAKMIGMAWCLLAFVACGFEHSVANMTAVALGLFMPTQAGDLGHAVYNLAVVSLGNLIGGSLFVTGAYSWAARGEAVALAEAPAPSLSTATATRVSRSKA